MQNAIVYIIRFKLVIMIIISFIVGLFFIAYSCYLISSVGSLIIKNRWQTNISITNLKGIFTISYVLY